MWYSDLAIALLSRLTIHFTIPLCMAPIVNCGISWSMLQYIKHRLLDQMSLEVICNALILAMSRVQYEHSWTCENSKGWWSSKIKSWKWWICDILEIYMPCTRTVSIWDWVCKTCIVYTFNFSTLVTHKIYYRTSYYFSIISENFSSVYHSLWLLWISTYSKSDVWTMHIFQNPVTYIRSYRLVPHIL